jgi:hypothetical protein
MLYLANELQAMTLSDDACSTIRNNSLLVLYMTHNPIESVEILSRLALKKVVSESAVLRTEIEGTLAQSRLLLQTQLICMTTLQ